MLDSVTLCLHISNVIYLVSYLARDMLWLRILTCCGLVLGIVFFSCQLTPLYGAISWQAAFLIINLYQIRRLIIDRRLLRLSEKQAVIGTETFQELSREELLNLLTRAMTDDPGPVGHIGHTCAVLSHEERVLRDIAFSRLSRNEIMNLLTRRMWTSLSRLNPSRWRKSRQTVSISVSDENATIDMRQMS